LSGSSAFARRSRGRYGGYSPAFVSILFAVLLMIFPGTGILALIWLLGIYAFVFGVILVMLGIRIRMHRPAK
jgi:uncharacterized membrane protein HdeD (DUF308 family)